MDVPNLHANAYSYLLYPLVNRFLVSFRGQRHSSLRCPPVLILSCWSVLPTSARDRVSYLRQITFAISGRLPWLSARDVRPYLGQIGEPLSGTSGEGFPAARFILVVQTLLPFLRRCVRTLPFGRRTLNPCLV